MGGVAGLKKENRDFSAKVGEGLVDKLKKVQSEVMVSVCGSCRVGLSSFANSYHPILLIAKSMGFKGS
jgi:Fe-S oxidoreductase